MKIICVRFSCFCVRIRVFGRVACSFVHVLHVCIHIYIYIYIHASSVYPPACDKTQVYSWGGVSRAAWSSMIRHSVHLFACLFRQRTYHQSMAAAFFILARNYYFYTVFSFWWTKATMLSPRGDVKIGILMDTLTGQRSNGPRWLSWYYDIFLCT